MQSYPTPDVNGQDVVLVGGEELHRVHPVDKCLGDHCPIHKVSRHSMNNFAQHWRSDRYLMERTCPHGIGHPDPDDPKIQFNVPGEDVHGCDGCCAGAYEPRWQG